MTGFGQTEHSMSSNLNANAKDFLPSKIGFDHASNDQNTVDEPKSTQSWNVSADEFVPLSFGTDPNTCAVDSMVKAWSPAAMNVNAEEFTPGLGLSEFGQTVEGWQGLGQRLEATFNTQATLSNVFAINPAFFCDDDESEDESGDGVLEKHSQNTNGNEDEQSNDANQESNVSTIDSLEKDTSNYGDTESSDENRDCNEILCDSDKDSNDGRNEAPELEKEGKCASSIADDSDKETSFNDGPDDLHTSSADESISVGTVSDPEASDQASVSLRPPPGLSLPPWKVKPRVADLHDSSEDDSASAQYRSRPWKLPPWKKAANLQVAGEATPVSSTPPWRKAEPSIVSLEVTQSPPALSLPPWKLPGWKQASKCEAAADLISEDEDFLQRPAARLPAWRR
jgi:hypothetical protein